MRTGQTPTGPGEGRKGQRRLPQAPHSPSPGRALTLPFIPQEICAAPQLFADTQQEGQVKQGLLGDCWFLCACAALSRNRRLLYQVFPADQPCWLDTEYQGAFTCRIWRFGQWAEVTVDDRLPCLAGRLCFSRCHKEDVFWLPLLEKAYAKVYGSYEHLWAGQVAEALVDLTGGLAERWSLKEHPEPPEPRTCQRLLGLQDRCPISCSVFSPRAGEGRPGPRSLLSSDAHVGSRNQGTGGISRLHCLGSARAPGPGRPEPATAANS